MADYTNTRDTLGEQATLDAIVSDTLTDLVEDGNSKLGRYALYKHSALQSVNFPRVTSTAIHAFEDCTALQTVEIGGKGSIATDAFRNATALESLILSNTSGITTLEEVDSLRFTNIATQTAGVYVPDALLSNYKSNDYWETYRHTIFPISEYPRTSYATISDSWTDIISASNDGTYSTKYKIGDTALLTINNQDFLVELIAKDLDVKADNSGTAHMTWLLAKASGTMRMNNSNITTGGWANSVMRTWLSGTVISLLPNELQNALVEVSKTYYDHGTSSTLTTADKIWLLSYRELNGGTSRESSGVTYDSINYYKFRPNGELAEWWLRSAKSNQAFDFTFRPGITSTYYASSLLGVVFGFCI